MRKKKWKWSEKISVVTKIAQFLSWAWCYKTVQKIREVCHWLGVKSRDMFWSDDVGQLVTQPSPYNSDCLALFYGSIIEAPLETPDTSAAMMMITRECCAHTHLWCLYKAISTSRQRASNGAGIGRIPAGKIVFVFSMSYQRYARQDIL